MLHNFVKPLLRNFRQIDFFVKRLKISLQLKFYFNISVYSTLFSVALKKD